MIVIGSLNYRVLRALAEAPARQLQAHRLAAAAGAMAREFQKRAARMVVDSLISPTKVRDAGHAYYWYSLTDAQLAKYRLAAALASVDQTTGAALVVEEIDLPGRLSFLRMLREKTAFRDHSVFAAIVGDFERTARLRRMADA